MADVKKSRVKESTYAKYRNSVAVYLQPFFEKVPLDTLTCAEVKKFRDELLARGGTRQTGLSEKTVADILALLKNILRYAEENYQLSICDISNLTVKQTKKEIRVFSRREEEKLCCYLYKERNLRNVGILLCLFTGIRIGELCALRWEDISMVESTIHIHRTMQRVQTSKDSAGKTKIIITSPKSDCSVRTIPIPKDLVEILENCQCSSGYFLTGENTVFIEPRSMQNHFKRVLKNCSLEDVNFHTLRHTFATRCVELGIDVKSLSEILGHSSVTITMNRYVHPSMEMKRESIERLFESFTVR